MKIDISGRHFQVTDGLKTHVADKADKLDKYGLKVEAMHVIFQVEKFQHVAEIVIRGKELRLTAKAKSTDMYAAFDKCFGSVQLQFSRLHDRVKDHKGRRYASKEKAEKE